MDVLKISIRNIHNNNSLNKIVICALSPVGKSTASWLHYMRVSIIENITFGRLRTLCNCLSSYNINFNFHQRTTFTFLTSFLAHSSKNTHGYKYARIPELSINQYLGIVKKSSLKTLRGKINPSKSHEPNWKIFAYWNYRCQTNILRYLGIHWFLEVIPVEKPDKSRGIRWDDHVLLLSWLGDHLCLRRRSEAWSWLVYPSHQMGCKA